MIRGMNIKSQEQAQWEDWGITPVALETNAVPTILLVDDDRSTLMLVARYLQKSPFYQYQVVTATNGKAAWDILQNLVPEVIISDWDMPGFSGIELCKKIRATPALHLCYFILLTSHAKLENRVQGLDAGADEFLTKPVEQEELRARVRAGLRLQQLSRDLQRQNQILESELDAAGRYVRSQIPAPIEGQVITKWLFRPSSQLGGDCFDYYWLDEDHLVLYLLDVSGHGVGSALLSASVLHILRSRSLINVDFRDPNQVLSSLNNTFPMGNHNDMYFTIWYGVYHSPSRVLRYACAGHPPGIVLQGNHIETIPPEPEGLPIGLLDHEVFPTQHYVLPAASTLFLYSDGIYEITCTDGRMWTFEEFLDLFRQHLSLEEVLAHVQTLSGQANFDDDISLLQIDFP